MYIIKLYGCIENSTLENENNYYMPAIESVTIIVSLRNAFIKIKHVPTDITVLTVLSNHAVFQKHFKSNRL